MANLNLEPGASTLAEMMASIERGVLMRDQLLVVDRRLAQQVPVRLRMGRLHRERRSASAVVKNPNYRGISATFWRSLRCVGNRDTFQVLGTPYCGKGEPNQVIRVGHASPACVFADVDVFGGE